MSFKKKYFITFLLAVICPVFGLFFVQSDNANAQQSSGPSISIAPHTFDLSVQRRDEIKEKIKIYNRGETAIPLRVSMDGFGAKDETGEMIEDNSQDLMIDWFGFEEESIIVDPGKTEQINFTIKIPADAEERGYYAVIFLEADISTYIYDESKLQVVPSMGIPFMIKVGNQPTEDTLTVLEYSVPEERRLKKTEKVFNFLINPFSKEDKISVIGSGSPSFIVRLKNSGLYHTKLSGTINLSGIGWKLKNELEFPLITILPGKTRKVLVENQVGGSEVSVFGIPSAIAAHPDDSPRFAVEAGTGSEQASENSKTKANVSFGLMRAELNLLSGEEIVKNENRWIFVFSWTGMFILLIVFIMLILSFFWTRRMYKMRRIPKRRAKYTLTSGWKDGSKILDMQKPKKYKWLDDYAKKNKEKVEIVPGEKEIIKPAKDRTEEKDKKIFIDGVRKK